MWSAPRSHPHPRSWGVADSRPFCVWIVLNNARFELTVIWNQGFDWNFSCTLWSPNSQILLPNILQFWTLFLLRFRVGSSVLHGRSAKSNWTQPVTLRAALSFNPLPAALSLRRHPSWTRSIYLEESVSLSVRSEFRLPSWARSIYLEESVSLSARPEFRLCVFTHLGKWRNFDFDRFDFLLHFSVWTFSFGAVALLLFSASVHVAFLFFFCNLPVFSCLHNCKAVTLKCTKIPTTCNAKPALMCFLSESGIRSLGQTSRKEVQRICATWLFYFKQILSEAECFSVCYILLLIRLVVFIFQVIVTNKSKMFLEMQFAVCPIFF